MKIPNEIDQVKKFLSRFSDDVIEPIITPIIEAANRPNRRKYKAIKTTSEKLNTLMERTTCRCEIIQKLNNQVNPDMDLSSVSYEKILTMMNQDNSTNYTVYLLSRCCDTEFDHAHFSDFIKSVQFQKTLNDSWNDETFSENGKSESVEENNLYGENGDAKKEVGDLGENADMHCYLGYIEKRKTYYNFKPLYKFENGLPEKINEDYFRTTKFPTYGKLNLAYHLGYYGYPAQSEPQKFLESLLISDVVEAVSNSQLYAISFYDNEIEENSTSEIKKKLDLENLVDKSIALSDRIRPLSSIGMYTIVVPKDDITIESFNDKIIIRGDCSERDNVLLKYNDCLFGPYSVQYRPIDDTKFIVPNISKSRYLLNYYSEKDGNASEYEFHMERMTVPVALLSGKSKIQDAIPNSVLIEKLTDTLDINLLRSNPEEFKRLYANSPFMHDIPEEIRSSRMHKIDQIFQSTSEFVDEKKSVVNALIDTDNDEIKKLLLDKFKNIDFVRQRDENIVSLKNELSKVQEENNTLKNKLQEKSEKEARAASDFIDSKEIEKLESENAALRHAVNEIADLEGQVSEYKNKIKYLKELHEEHTKEIINDKRTKEELVADFQKNIKNLADDFTMKDAIQKALDPYVAHVLAEMTGNWEETVEEEKHIQIAESMRKLKYQSINKEALIEHLVQGIQQFRAYSKNEILNMLICVSQNFLTIFAGEPGTGKTSICDILANSLGLNLFTKQDSNSINRYVSVSVERGWTSKRDLIGYYNPLTQTYDRNNGKIYDALMVLNAEQEESRFPFIILLDEANLSQMEYYWADFMKAADKTDSDVYINIGLKKDLYIPKTLHFLATINTDQTTERLSPRLIDRAWIIKLPSTPIKENLPNLKDVFKKIISWDDMKSAFIECSESQNGISLNAVLEQIYKLFEDYHLAVSPRVKLSIKKYICVAENIMEDEVGGSNKEQKALDYAIVQKLLPKINGYYQTYERLFKALEQICNENNLNMTKSALDTMQIYAEQNMGYCEYLV